MAKKEEKLYDNKELSKHFRRLSAQHHDVVVDEKLGTRGRTKGQALAETIYDIALGHEERSIDDEGGETLIVHKPVAWAMQFIFDRMEGKAPQAIPENEGRRTAKDKVGELATRALNDLVEEEAVPMGPPSLPPLETDDAS